MTIEDLHAFNQHYTTTAELPRRNQRLVRLVLTALLASLLMALGAWARPPWPFWLTGLLILGFWWRVFPFRIAQLMRVNTERLYREGKNRGILGPHRIAAEPEWLLEASSDREHRTRWRAIEQVVETEQHLFVYVSGFSSVIVPKRAFATAEDRERFVATVHQRAEARA